MPQFQIISDIHLEFKNARESMPEIEVKSELLCLLGDIGYPFLSSYKEFIIYQASRFPHVIVIAGNHEFYCPDDKDYTFEGVLREISSICDEIDNVYFLYRESLELPCFPNIRFIGATLWTNIPSKYKYDLSDMCNDYNYIYTHCSTEQLIQLTTRNIDSIEINKNIEERNLTVDEQNRLHEMDLGYIKKELHLAEQLKQTAIILTHHAPTDRNTIPEDEDWIPLRFMNYSSLEDLFKIPIRVWGFGHTHRCSKMKIEECQIVSNQLGYVKHHDTQFKPDFVIQFEMIDYTD